MAKRLSDRIQCALLIILGAVGALCAPEALCAQLEPILAEKAMVVSASREASEAGVAIMKRGGNAIDAAVTTGFVLAVTYPQAGNLGGGGFLVARLASGRTFTLDFRERAPKNAQKDMYLDENGNVIDGLSLRSPLASGVPGSVDGLLRVWRDHGSGALSRKQILAPAIRLAEKGFPLSSAVAAALNEAKEFLSNDPAALKIFTRHDGRSWRQGDYLIQQELARTLRRIAKQGPRGFYQGPTAQRLADQMARTGGIITLDDLQSYASRYRDPVTGTFRDYEILSMGPPSSGGVLLVHMLNMLETYSIEELAWNSAAYVHLLTEVQRRAYADRAEHLGDPDFWPIPMAGLASKDYARQRAKDISPDQATPSTAVSAGAPAPYQSEETTHYSVVGPQGAAVAVTTTLNGPFGSGIVVEGAGFLLNNEMDDFALKPGTPNLYGLVGNEANAVAPRKRMLSSMTPTIIAKDGRPLMVLGTPGGATIITTTLQVFLNVALHGMDIRQAVSAPRHHSQWLPDQILFEPQALSSEVQETLKAMGHTVVSYKDTSIGQANCILVSAEGIQGAPDPRGGNWAAGF